MTTIKSALAHARESLAHSPSAALDARVLLCHVLQCRDAYLFTWPEKSLEADQQAYFEQLLLRRRSGEPVAYITGMREFYGRDFLVSPATLIPRPDTETLVDAALSIERTQPMRVLDAGTGTGAVGITLALERPAWQVTVMDRSMAALHVAQANARSLGAAVGMFCGDWLSAIRGSVDVIVSNPPYIDGHDPHLSEGDVRHEPRAALVADKRGLADIDALVAQARERLLPGGWLMVEHGFQQAQPVAACFARAGYVNIRCQHDLADNPRVTLGQWGRPHAD